MMFISQLVLNPRSPDVMGDLANPYQLHSKVMSGFPPDLPAGERILFRLEFQPQEPYLSLLVQSHVPPNWDGLATRGYLLRPPAVKTLEYRPSLEQTFRFRLVANPTKRLHGEGGKDGPRIGLVREEDQLAWLERKGEQHGFRVLTVRTTKIVQPDGWKREKGKVHRIRHKAVRFDGYLQVTDDVIFTQALIKGIGSGKGFGFGLLSLASAG